MRPTLPLTALSAGLLFLSTSMALQHTPVGQPVTTPGGGAPHNIGLPQFSRVLLLEKAADTSANVSIGDLNGDGNLDIVLVKGRHWPGMSRVLLGDGRGHFPTAYDLGEAKYRSCSGRLVDIDGDRDLDIVLSNDTPDAKLILANDGRGQFHVASTFGRAEWETRNAAIADLNGDGLPDIIVANRADDASDYICLNQGKGRFDADCIAFAHYSATTITPADFNHDGLIDLVVPHRDGGQSYVYLNGGRATFAKNRTIPFGPPTATIRMTDVADLDGDGLLDIVVTDDERRSVEIYYGRKGGTFSSAVVLDNGQATPYALAVADLNQDGRPDIIVGNIDAPSTVYFNDTGGRHYTAVPFGDNKGTVYGFAVADLDGDGRLDIAVARSEAPSLVYFADSARLPAR
jgi:hypothetical protein